MEILNVLFWSLFGSVLSLVGGILLIGNRKSRVIAARYGMAFGAGSLLAAAFVVLLPEAVEAGDLHQTGFLALGGFLTFLILERLFGWFHRHETSDDQRNHAHQWLVIIGDTLHNAIDGVVLGLAFLVSPEAGMITAVAIAAHEIPQEIGDFSILLARGMRPSRVILVNVMSAMATVATALIAFMIGGTYEINSAPLLAVAAGFFVYIAASDIIPDIHTKSRREGDLQTAVLLIGVVVISLIVTMAPHDHELESDSHASNTTMLV